MLEAARRAGAFVLEDDWARYLPQEGTSPPPLLHDDDDGHVVHLSSLSKASAPSLRIGALIARGPAAARLASAQLVENFGVARPLQETAVELLGSPAWPRHLAQLARSLGSRRDHLVAELHRHLPQLDAPAVPHGGLHLWLTLPVGIDDIEPDLACASATPPPTMRSSAPASTSSEPRSSADGSGVLTSALAAGVA